MIWENVNLRFRVRRRTAANWASLNEILLDSEIGRESDTDRFKFGDGVTAWNSLAYAAEYSPITTEGDLIVGDAGNLPARLPVGDEDDALRVVSGVPTWVSDPPSISLGTIGAVFDGGGAAIAVGSQSDIPIPYACTITKATILAEPSGSIVVDVWKDTYTNYPPTVADTITASSKPTISTGIKSQDATLTGWTITIAAGDTLRFNVDSCSTIERATLILEVQKI